MYGKASENAVAHYQMKESTKPINYNDIKEYIDYDGAEVICDDFVINYDGTVYLSECSVGGYLVENYSYGELLAIKEGTLAYDILEKNGGIDSIERLTIDWKKETTSNSRDVSVNTSMNYYFADEYELDKKTGEYSLDGNIVKATIEECRTGAKTCGKYTFLSTNEKQKELSIYKITSFLPSEPDVIGIEYVQASIIQVEQENNDFTDINAGLHKVNDDLGISYVYSGNVTNNYVKFGKWDEDHMLVYEYYPEYDISAFYNGSLEECNSSRGGNCFEEPMMEAGKDMYWRIVRINGDGTIRLVYSGVEGNVGFYSIHNEFKSHYFNEIYDPHYDNNHYGYTYELNGIETDSTIKSTLDKWYNKNLKEKYGKYIADGIFCNDKTIIKEEYNSNWNVNQVFFSGSRRMENNTPVLTCSNIDDRYSVSSIGNGKLKYPIGLLTVDEYFINENQYITNSTIQNAYFWTLTPHHSDESVSVRNSYIFINSSEYENTSLSPANIQPVINLKADVKFKGNGSIETPYEIVME